MQGIILQFRDVTSDIRVITIQMGRDRQYKYTAGQYTEIQIDGHEARYFSIANAPRADNTIDIHVRNTGGETSSALCSAIKQGQPVTVSPAQGNLMYDTAHTPAVFIAGGTGITPFLAMIDAHKGKSFHVYWGAKKDNEFYVRPQQNGLAMHYCVDEFPVDAHIYLSGPPNMVHDSRVKLLANGIEPSRIYSDA
jgi:ferredoxin-NADP reductase